MGTWIAQNITLPKHVTMTEEKENALSHFLGLFLAVIGFLYVVSAYAPSGHPMARTGMIIFALSNIVLYASSAFYHALKPGLAKIAGSYTPILLYIGSPVTVAYTVGIWCAATIGIVLTVRFWGRFYPVHIALYVVMGWSVLTIYDSVFPFIPSQILAYALAGGIIYTLGVLFYSVRRIPHHHLIWHIFVLVASIAFFIGYSLYLLA